ncbi:LuxR C-terminal-related transcriptional regulator [Pelomonas sp. SE-A7]|uniref:helix-turn-helix transcriptional regulator n=1 Tax=Pelomonas sp. SE-A7 TaxID=3054953 RepID=UPI00259CA3A0|nr:LuxR C-terminal-related transcriptional regulator [Pelomonas sp. SE-A7]MDM4767097.1 LuxR C-terminal-related transcriptional regulator [Pelomonas sp. SE-A7]
MITTDHLSPAPRNAGAGYWSQAERRSADSLSSHWLSLVLDELDYGLLVVDQLGRVLQSNAAARQVLTTGRHPLELLGNQLQVRHAKDAQPLFAALTAAETQGRRCLLRLGEDDAQANVVLVPLNRQVSQAAVLLALERPALCGELAAQWFALRYGLTPTETEVLKALGAGEPPTAIATRQGVAISTVRTQIQSIRAKSGAQSIRELLHQLAVLPPLASALRL